MTVRYTHHPRWPPSPPWLPAGSRPRNDDRNNDESGTLVDDMIEHDGFADGPASGLGRPSDRVGALQGGCCGCLEGRDRRSDAKPIVIEMPSEIMNEYDEKRARILPGSLRKFAPPPG